MKMLQKQPDNDVVTQYRRLSRRIASNSWDNLSKAVVDGSEGNGELRRFLQRK